MASVLLMLHNVKVYAYMADTLLSLTLMPSRIGIPGG